MIERLTCLAELAIKIAVVGVMVFWFAATVAVAIKGAF